MLEYNTLLVLTFNLFSLSLIFPYIPQCFRITYACCNLIIYSILMIIVTLYSIILYIIYNLLLTI